MGVFRRPKRAASLATATCCANKATSSIKIIIVYAMMGYEGLALNAIFSQVFIAPDLYSTAIRYFATFDGFCSSLCSQR